MTGLDVVDRLVVVALALVPLVVALAVARRRRTRRRWRSLAADESFPFVRSRGRA